MTSVLPSANNWGKDLGVINIANAFPQMLGLAVAAFAIITFHSYTVLFILETVLALLGALLVQRIKGVRKGKARICWEKQLDTEIVLFYVILRKLLCLSVYHSIMCQIVSIGSLSLRCSSKVDLCCLSSLLSYRSA